MLPLTGDLWMSLGLGLALGYLLGWHRGAMRLSILPRFPWRRSWHRRPSVRSSSTDAQPIPQTPEEAREQAESYRAKVDHDLAQMYPHLTASQRKGAVEEILGKGALLRAGLRPQS